MGAPSIQQRIEHDSKLIAAASQCIALYQGLDQLERKVELSSSIEALFGPEVQGYRGKIQKLALSVRNTQARTVRGLAAKARLFEILDDGSSMPLEPHSEPTDCGALARSICSDIARLQTDYVRPPTDSQTNPKKSRLSAKQKER